MPFWIWQHAIRPRLIPGYLIKAMTDLMLSTFGPYAEHEAFLRHLDACYHDDLFARGVWARIRRHLRRRWARGEIELYDSDEVAQRARAARSGLQPQQHAYIKKNGNK